MPRKREPIDLVAAKGRSHKTKAEIEKRRSEEVKALADSIMPPAFLTKAAQKTEFNRLSKELVALGIMSNLDCDELARYIMASEDYRFYIKAASDARKKPIDLEVLKSYESLKGKAFMQCQACAAALGLNISARCKLVVPKKEESKVNKFDKYSKVGAV